MQNQRLIVALLCGFAACAGSSTSQDDASVNASDRPHRRDAGAVVDARGNPADAPIATPDASSTGSSGAVVSCYTEGNPTQMCGAPDHCCFSNYSAQHNGFCTLDTCAYGTITCDGPEDCASGQTCCAHAITDPNDGTVGYRLACQTGGCGAAPLNQELCHPNAGTCSHGACVTAYQHDNDLPRTLYICQ